MDARHQSHDSMTGLLPFPANRAEPELAGIPLADAIAALRGERSLGPSARGFAIEGLQVWALEAMECPAGEEMDHLDDAVRKIVRTRQAQGAQLGMILARANRTASVNLVSPASDGDPAGWTSGALPSASWRSGGSLDELSARLLSSLSIGLGGPPRGIGIGQAGIAPGGRALGRLRGFHPRPSGNSGCPCGGAAQPAARNPVPSRRASCSTRTGAGQPFARIGLPGAS